MVGDRMTDMEFALNFGGKGIFIDTHADLGAEEVKNDVSRC
jgi:imidazoleglycerol-phosphate dehydratase / histidinol-phosphatase